eukprot:7665786-Prorocentrum_lima.AAC.1
MKRSTNTPVGGVQIRVRAVSGPGSRVGTNGGTTRPNGVAAVVRQTHGKCENTREDTVKCLTRG